MQRQRQQWQNVLEKKSNEPLHRKVNGYEKQINDILLTQHMINERKKLLEHLFNAERRENQREMDHMMIEYLTQPKWNQKISGTLEF